MTFVVEHDGRVSEFDDDHLLVFVDETGDERLLSKDTPFFGFGGCLCRASDYVEALEHPWDTVEAHFDLTDRRLHAADLRPTQMTNEQMSSLNQFFSKGKFGRFAAVGKRGMINETGQSPFHIISRMALEKLIETIRQMGGDFRGVVMIFEHSQRLDSLYADYFQRYSFQRKNGDKVECFYATQAKSAGKELASGLVVADFISHTAGIMSRTTLGGTVSAKRRDFSAVFSHELANHIFIDAAR